MRRNIMFLTIVALVISANALWGLKNNSYSWGKKDTSWYAVYLSNNQIYLGHIASIQDDQIVLDSTHFAEVHQEAPQVVKGKTFAIEQPAKQTFKVIQRGDEKMLSSDHRLFINRASVLYWEKFSPDAEIVKLLEEEK